MFRGNTAKKQCKISIPRVQPLLACHSIGKIDTVQRQIILIVAAVIFFICPVLDYFSLSVPGLMG